MVACAGGFGGEYQCPSSLDIYYVDDAGDVVIELDNEGTADLVVSSITYALTDNVE